MRRPSIASSARPVHASPWATVLALVVLAAGVTVRAWLPQPARNTPDELAYTFYSSVLALKGPVAIPRMVADFNAHPELKNVPPPTRVGHLWLAAGLMRLTGSTTLRTVASLSMIASIATFVLLGVVAWTAFGPWVAMLAMLFLVASPLDLAIARRAWGDDLIGLFAFGTLCTLAAAAARPVRWRWAVASVSLGAFSLLIKETGVFVLGFATLALALAAWRSPRGPRAAALALGAGAAAFALALVVIAIACGGFDPVRAALARVAAATAADSYVREYQTGSPLYYVVGLGLLQPLPFALGLLGSLLVAARVPFVNDRGRARTPAMLGLSAWFVLAFALLAALYPQKNMRFLSVLYAPIVLMAAVLVRAALAWAGTRLPAVPYRIVVGVVAVSLALAAWADFERFRELFLRRDILDLATPWFTKR